jgi:hypothetical protein
MTDDKVIDIVVRLRTAVHALRAALGIADDDMLFDMVAATLTAAIRDQLGQAVNITVEIDQILKRSRQ